MYYFQFLSSWFIHVLFKFARIALIFFPLPQLCLFMQILSHTQLPRCYCTETFYDRNPVMSDAHYFQFAVFCFQFVFSELFTSVYCRCAIVMLFGVMFCSDCFASVLFVTTIRVRYRVGYCNFFCKHMFNLILLFLKLKLTLTSNWLTFLNRNWFWCTSLYCIIVHFHWNDRATLKTSISVYHDVE